MSDKRKLAERVEWRDNVGDVYSCVVGIFQLDVFPRTFAGVLSGWVWRLWVKNSCVCAADLVADNEEAAKAEALVIVQALVLKAAEAFKD